VRKFINLTMKLIIMRKLKPSRYNLTVPSSTNLVLIYNTLSGAILRCNSKFVADLNTKNLDADLEKIMHEQGFLVSPDTDELAVYRGIHNHWKSGKEKVEFNMLLTYDCNFACPYCYQGRGEAGKKIHGFKSMSPSMISSFKEFVKMTVLERNPKTLELILYGGEPMLRAYDAMRTTDELSEWVNDVGMKFKLQMLSNGSLITKEFIEWADQFRMRLQVPIDGDRDMHNKMRFYVKDKRGSFDDVTDGVLSFVRGTNVETHIRISLTNETYPTMINMLDQLKSKDLTHIYTDFCYITAFTEACDAYKNHVIPDTKLFSVMPELWRAAHERGFRLDIRPSPQALPCSSIADGSYIIDPFGDVYKCWELVGQKKHVVGTLSDNGVFTKTAVYGDVLKRDPTMIDQCSRHIFLPSCAGGCVCKASWLHNTYHAAGCGTENFLLPDKVKLFAELAKSPKTLVMSDGLFAQLVDGRIEPKMKHCYTLV